MFIELWILSFIAIAVGTVVLTMGLFISEGNHDRAALRRSLKFAAHQRNDYEARARTAEQTLADIRAFDRMVDTLNKD